jgi:hypothetical protein
LWAGIVEAREVWFIEIELFGPQIATFNSLWAISSENDDILRPDSFVETKPTYDMKMHHSQGDNMRQSYTIVERD